MPGQKFDEKAFQRWYAYWAGQMNLDPNPDNPLHFYDYRAAYRAGVSPDSESRHWPSEFKRWGHPNQFVEGYNTITGKPATEWDKFIALRIQQSVLSRLGLRNQLAVE